MKLQMSRAVALVVALAVTAMLTFPAPPRARRARASPRGGRSCDHRAHRYRRPRGVFTRAVRRHVALWCATALFAGQRVTGRAV
jgi:hypothetical protein